MIPLGILASAYRSAFTPSDLTGLQLWLDASDAATITQTSGSVSQWSDKSGNSLHVTQGTATNQPKSNTATQNGLTVLDFDANDNLARTSASNLGRNVGAVTVYVVGSFNAVSAVQDFVHFTRNGGGSSSSRVRLGHNNIQSPNKLNAGGRRLDADAFASVASTSNAPTGAFRRYTALFDYANSDLFVWIGTTAEGSKTSFQTAGSTSDTTSDQLHVGTNLDGKIAEILVYHAAHGSTERAQVWDYLAAKWGL